MKHIEENEKQQQVEESIRKKLKYAWVDINF